MRPCDTEPLTLKPFATDTHVLVVGEDRVAREVVWGGAGRFESHPALTLYVPADGKYPIGSPLTVNLIPGPHRPERPVHYEEGLRAPLIAESRLAFECTVLATGSLDDASARGVVVARVHRSHQRWPRGCAIT